MQDIKVSSAAASADHCAADLFHAELLSVVDTEGHLSKQIFNPNKLGLYWKQMPARTFISLCAAVGNPKLKVLPKHGCHYHYSGHVGGYQGIHSECCMEEGVAELCP